MVNCVVVHWLGICNRNIYISISGQSLVPPNGIFCLDFANLKNKIKKHILKKGHITKHVNILKSLENKYIVVNSDRLSLGTRFILLNTEIAGKKHV